MHEFQDHVSFVSICVRASVDSSRLASSVSRAQVEPTHENEPNIMRIISGGSGGHDLCVR